MNRATGVFRQTRHGEETVRAFVPLPLPPTDPPLEFGPELAALHAQAIGAVDRIRTVGRMLPSAEWFIYGFVRREAVITSEIEGTRATLRDVMTFEATGESDRPDDVREVCNYIDALEYARREISRPKGLPLSTRLLCQAHKRLMKGARGADKQPGEIRRSQNWIGGTRPGNARFVPPPPEDVPRLLGDLENWIHAPSDLPPLVRAGLAHVQFETIHPFLDGNGRIGRLLIALLLEHWGVLDRPILYLSVAIRRRQREYYDRLAGVRDPGDWEGWTTFFLECVRDAADDGVTAAQKLSAILDQSRSRASAHPSITVPGLRLLELLPGHPVLTLSKAVELLEVSKPTAIKAIESLVAAKVLRETTGRKRGRVYAYQDYLEVLTRP